jgi:hypothetical protein
MAVGNSVAPSQKWNGSLGSCISKDFIKDCGFFQKPRVTIDSAIEKLEVGPQKSLKFSGRRAPTPIKFAGVPT